MSKDIYIYGVECAAPYCEPCSEGDFDNCRFKQEGGLGFSANVLAFYIKQIMSWEYGSEEHIRAMNEFINYFGSAWREEVRERSILTSDKQTVMLWDEKDWEIFSN